MPTFVPAEPYDPANVFARILRGELPCSKVFEDAETLAFMDIMPRCQGHTLVIPKEAARNLLDVSPAALAATMRTTQRVSRAAMAAYAAPGVTILQANEAAGGQEVFHLHVHVMPRQAGAKLGPAASKMAPREQLEADAARLRAALAT